MKLSPITKDQWTSVVRNSVFAALGAFIMAVQTQPMTRAGLYAAGATAIMAALKIVEKAFTPTS